MQIMIAVMAAVLKTLLIYIAVSGTRFSEIYRFFIVARGSQGSV